MSDQQHSCRSSIDSYIFVLVSAMGLLHTRHKFTYDLPAVHALREKNLVSKPPVERDQVGKGAHLVAQPGIYLSGDVDVGFSDVYDADVSGDYKC